MLLAIDAKSVSDARDVLDVVSGISPGRSAKLKINRKGKEMELTVIVGKRPKPQPGGN